MNRTYEEWLKYYKNATKEQVIEDMMLDIKEIDRLKQKINKAIEYIEHYAIEDEDYSKLYSIEERELLQILRGDK